MKLFGFGRMKTEDVVKQGASAEGRIVGIHVDEITGDDGATNKRVFDYAIEVAAIPPFTAGVRQDLDPDDVVRLGMAVTVHHLEGSAVIDWPATCGGTDRVIAALLKQPPDPGIRDDTLKLARAAKKGVPATVTIDQADVVSGLMGMTRTLQLGVTVVPDDLEPYATELTKVFVPHYATHLCVAGGQIPGFVRPNRLDRVTLDWPSAAMADPGIGVAPAPILAEVGNALSDALHGKGDAGSAVSTDDAAEAQTPPAGGDRTPIDGVTFEMWVAVDAGLIRDRVAPADADAYAQARGVPPGAWAGAVAQWNQRMMSDWQLGAAYGAAIEAARRGR